MKKYDIKADVKRPDGEPSYYTDYELYFPQDFFVIPPVTLLDNYDENYRLCSFTVPRGTLQDDLSSINTLREEAPRMEHAMLYASYVGQQYRATNFLTGEMGFGFEIRPGIAITDILHTHSIFEGEDESVVNLFSASDLLLASVRRVLRTWIVARNEAYCLVNYFGDRYYYEAKKQCGILEKEYNPADSFEIAMSRLLECVRLCEFHLYRSEDLVGFDLIS